MAVGTSPVWTGVPAGLRIDQRDETRPPLQVKVGVGVRVMAGGAPVIVGGPGEVATRM